MEKKKIFLLVLLAATMRMASTQSSSGRFLSSLNLTANLTTQIETGENICLPSMLEAPLKSNMIFIGVVGCEFDPLLVALMIEDTSHMNDNCTENVTVNRPPIPEYIIAVFSTVQKINNNPDILPYHLICLRSAITKGIPNILSSTYTSLVNKSDVPVVLDVIWDEISAFSQSLILPFAIPIVRFSRIGRFHLTNIESIISSLKDEQRTHVHTDENPALEMLSKEFLFTIAPQISTIQVIDDVAKYFGWKKVGLVLERELAGYDANPFNEIQARFTIFLSVNYEEGNLFANFQPFIENEIQVFAFYGHAHAYLKMLHEASKYKFVNDETVWIYTYFDIIFPDNYANIWCGMSPEEIFTIKNALRGTLLIGPNKGMGKRYDEFIADFPIEAEQISAGLGEDFKKRELFIQTPYISDSILTIAQAMDALVKSKANESDLELGNVTILREDTLLLSRKLSEVHVTEGITGEISFTSSGERSFSLFEIRNFVPIENTNFSLQTVHDENPWEIKRKGLVKTGKGGMQILHYSDDGNLSTSSTVVFADGTTNIPPDHPHRVYIRDNNKVRASFTVMWLAFLIAFGFFLASVYYNDRKVIELQNVCIYSKKDLEFFSDKDSSLGERFLSQINKISNCRPESKGKVARLKKNRELITLSPAILSKAFLTREVFLEIKKLRTISHPNVALFYGCLMNRSNSAFLYEYCSRGTLHDVLHNSDLEMDWVFRLSFALDIAEGMSYLHARKVIHGRLSTIACLIDDNWTLKVKDYGLKELHTLMDAKSATIKKKTAFPKSKISRRAPELLGSKATFKTDVYNFGQILEELSWMNLENTLKRALSSHFGRSSTVSGRGAALFHRINKDHEDMIAPKIMKLMKKCVHYTPEKRPSFDWLITNLRQVSHLFAHKGKNKTSMLHVYARLLEDHIEELMDLIVAEKSHNNNIIRSFIPKMLIKPELEGTLKPLEQYHTTVLAIEIANVDDLMKMVPIQEFNKLLVSMQKIIEGVLHNRDMNWILTSGTSWIAISAGEDDQERICNSIHAAFNIFCNLKEVVVKGRTNLRPTTRAGLHTGDVVCGVVECPLPKLISFGNAISAATQLMFSGQDGRILATNTLVQKAAQRIDGLLTRHHIAMEIQNEVTAITWILKPDVPTITCQPPPPPLPVVSINQFQDAAQPQPLPAMNQGATIITHQLPLLSSSAKNPAFPPARQRKIMPKSTEPVKDVSKEKEEKDLPHSQSSISTKKRNSNPSVPPRKLSVYAAPPQLSSLSYRDPFAKRSSLPPAAIGSSPCKDSGRRSSLAPPQNPLRAKDPPTPTPSMVMFSDHSGTLYPVEGPTDPELSFSNITKEI